MNFRLITAAIFVFCGTMTWLLVRSVLNPEASKLAAVAPNVPFDLFAPRTEGSSLDVWDGNRIVGSCDIAPHSPGRGADGRTQNVMVQLDVRIALPQEIMGSRRLDVSGDLMLHSDGNVDGLKLDFVLWGSVPQIRLTVRQPADSEFPSLKLTRDANVLFEFPAGREADPFSGLIVSSMLRNVGISEDVLSSKPSPKTQPAAVRAGHIEAGGETFDGYLLTSGATSETQFRLYMSNTGQILRITTPLTGENGLGLRLLAKSLAPRDAERSPVLQGHLLPRPAQ